MRTVILDPLPPEVERLVETRKRLGLDTFDEVWEGAYHMAPAAKGRHGYLAQQLAEILGPSARAAGLVASAPFNLGERDNLRVPDLGIHRAFNPRESWYATAAMVVEVTSPGDETWDKLPFYAAHGVDEVLIVEPDARRVHLLRRDGKGYADAETSGLVKLGRGDLEARLDWG